MSFDNFLNKINTNPEFAFIVYSVAIFVVLVLVVVLFIVRRNADKHNIKSIIKDIGNDFIQDVALPDGMDGYVFVDYLVLTPTGILVVDVENYNGFLFGGDHIDEWTQMIGHKSYKFKNPLPHHQQNVQSVISHTGTVPVQGRLVFTSEGSFPKGIPDGVSTAGSLKQDVSKSVVGNSIPAIFQEVWKELGIKSLESNQQLGKKR